MFTKKISIKNTEEIAGKNRILGHFLNCIHEKYGFQHKFNTLIKTGERYKFRGLENIMLYPLISDDNKEITRIDYAKFSQDALKEIDQFRLIGNELYKICEKPLYSIEYDIKENENYIFSIDWNPEFTISNSKYNSKYWFDIIKFQSFDKKEFLNYIPINEKGSEFSPNEIRIEALLKKGSILNQTYKAILEH
jgi:hypothetical protein